MEEKQILGKCPKCGGDIVETKKAYSCENWRDASGGCKFAIWKTIAQRPITPSDARVLLEEGKTMKLDGFRSKAGNPFRAALMIDEEFKVRFVF